MEIRGNKVNRSADYGLEVPYALNNFICQNALLIDCTRWLMIEKLKKVVYDHCIWIFIQCITIITKKNSAYFLFA